MKTLSLLVVGMLFIFFGIILVISGNYILPLISGAIGVGFIAIFYNIEEKEDEGDHDAIFGEIWPDVKTRMEQKHDTAHTDLKGKRRTKARKRWK